MVMGVFMCVLLVGALWYIAGVGDALIYRERMQEAADSAAFSAAIIQARGMNIIVMINLLMAAILAIRVAINMLKMLCTVLAAVFWGISLIPFCEWAAAPAGVLTDAADELYNLDQSISPAINAALQGLNGAWTAISYATPALADLRARWRWRGSTAHPSRRLLESLPLSGDLPPMTIKLPVEDGSLDKLCDEAGAAVGGVFTSVIGNNPVGSLLSAAVSGASSGLDPSYFCELPRGEHDAAGHVGSRLRSQAGSQRPGLQQRADAATQAYNSLVAADASPAAISAAQTKMDSPRTTRARTAARPRSRVAAAWNGSSTSSSGSFTLPGRRGRGQHRPEPEPVRRERQRKQQLRLRPRAGPDELQPGLVQRHLGVADRLHPDGEQPGYGADERLPPVREDRGAGQGPDADAEPPHGAAERVGSGGVLLRLQLAVGELVRPQPERDVELLLARALPPLESQLAAVDRAGRDRRSVRFLPREDGRRGRERPPRNLERFTRSPRKINLSKSVADVGFNPAIH